MKEPDSRAARRAVELLASSVAAPAPPQGLRAGRPGRGRAAGLLGATAIVLVAAALILTMWPSSEERSSAGATSGVVVQHLRVAGKPVSTRVKTIPGSDAVVVIALDERVDAQPSSRDAALAMSAGWGRGPRTRRFSR